jgi:hypothetical protein
MVMAVAALVAVAAGLEVDISGEAALGAGVLPTAASLGIGLRDTDFVAKTGTEYVAIEIVTAFAPAMQLVDLDSAFLVLVCLGIHMDMKMMITDIRASLYVRPAGSVQRRAGFVLGRGVSEGQSGGTCATPVKTYELYHSLVVGNGCSCKVPGRTLFFLGSDTPRRQSLVVSPWSVR